MRTKKKKIVSIACLLFLVSVMVSAFLPVNAVNVVFSEAMTNTALKTVFSGTSFKANECYFLTGGGSGLARTSNELLFGAPLEDSLRYPGLPVAQEIIVLDGNISLLDMIKIKKSPYVDTVILYFPILDLGDRDILPESTSLFFDKHPQARYWE